MRIARLAPVLATALALTATAAGPAAAAPTATPLAPVTSDSPLAAYGGYVVWSERGDDGQWRLVELRDGAKTVLNQVPPRAVAFDVDAGPDAAGRPVAVYSRCAKERAEGTLQPWASARGCVLEQVALDGGGQAELPVPRPAGAVDGTPTRWKDQVAFQRRSAGHRDVAQIELYDMKTKKLRTLPHGAVPHGCHYKGGCKAYAYRGEAVEMDLGPKTLAFSWNIQSPVVEGVGGGWEMRVDRLRDGARLLAGTGYISGACGGRFPASPNATATGLWFLNRVYPCDGVEGTVTTGSFAAASLSAAAAPDGATIWRIARDGGTVYGLLGPSHTDGATAFPAGAFSLVRLDGLAPQPTGKVAHDPFF
jgi:hypothetical protein